MRSNFYAIEYFEFLVEFLVEFLFAELLAKYNQNAMDKFEEKFAEKFMEEFCEGCQGGSLTPPARGLDGHPSNSVPDVLSRKK